MEGVAEAAEEVPVVDWAATLSATARRARAGRKNIVNGGGGWETTTTRKIEEEKKKICSGVLEALWARLYSEDGRLTGPLIESPRMMHMMIDTNLPL